MKFMVPTLQRVVLAAVALLAITLTPRAALATEAPRQIIQLLDYLGRDYAGAVSNGAVISEFEYLEQKEFVRTAYAAAASLPSLAGNAEFMAGLNQLIVAIDQKADATEIESLTGRLRAEVLTRTGIAVSPPDWPDVKAGEKVYAEHCVACHGPTGEGDGPAGYGMTPPPTAFHNAKVIGALTPFQAYNTIRNGIGGTGMAGFSKLTEEQSWNVAFYLFSLQYAGQNEEQVFASAQKYTGAFPSLADLATKQDAEIAATLSSDPPTSTDVVKALRIDPKKLLASQKELFIARTLLAQAETAYRNGALDEARQLALQAYLDGIEPFEVRLQARDSEIVPLLESRMLHMRSLMADRAPLAEVLPSIELSKEAVDLAEKVLGETTMSFGATALASFLIFLREGFEAVLIVIALLAVLRKLEAPKAIRWTHLGWIGAIAAGFATWLVSERFIAISGAGREVMEGVVGLVAVAVLAYMGIWLHGQAEIRKWATFVNQQARRAVAENRYFTFFGIAFLAVFREAFETVLFYRALALETTAENNGALFVGLMAGIIAIGALTWAMLKIGARIPLQKFFQVSAAIIFTLTIVLMGKGLHAFQEAGWVSISSFPVNVRVDLLGIFPTYETLGAQAILLAVLLLIRWFIHTSAPRRQAAASSST